MILEEGTDQQMMESVGNLRRPVPGECWRRKVERENAAWSWSVIVIAVRDGIVYSVEGDSLISKREWTVRKFEELAERGALQYDGWHYGS